MPIMIETREEFIARHGGETYPLPHNGGLILRDGAVIDNWGMGEPPHDPVERQRAQYQFASAKLTFLIQRYQSLHKAVGQDVEFVSKNMAVVPPDPKEFALLEKWAAEIIKVRNERDKLWSVLPEAQRYQQLREKDQQRSGTSHALASKFFELPTFGT